MSEASKKPIVFHGTTIQNVEQILKEGFVANKYCDAMRSYISECIGLGLPNAHGQQKELLELLELHKSDHPILVANVVATFSEGMLASNFEYGDLYVTTGLGHAASYAGHRPELQRAASEIQRIMGHFDRECAQRLLLKHRDLLDWANDASASCVVGIAVSSNSEIFTDTNQPVDFKDLLSALVSTDELVGLGCEAGTPFRLGGAVAQDICFILPLDQLPDKVLGALYSLPSDSLEEVLKELPFWIGRE